MMCNNFEINQIDSSIIGPWAEGIDENNI